LAEWAIMLGHMGGKEIEGGSSGFRSLKGDGDRSTKYAKPI